VDKVDIKDVLFWYFIYIPKTLNKIYIGTIKYVWNFFSIAFLFKSLMMPWKKDIIISVNPTLQETISNLAENLISRIIGFLIRSTTIIIGLITITICDILFLAFYPIWFLLPLIAFMSLIYSIKLMVQNVF